MSFQKVLISVLRIMCDGKDRRQNPKIIRSRLAPLDIIRNSTVKRKQYKQSNI